MTLERSYYGRRGIAGLETAVIIIVLVIVAAALAFVVLNMGFSTTQKAKTTIVSSLGEASSALEVAGIVIGSGDVSSAELEVLAVPIKIASGGESVNLQNTTTAIKYLSNSVTYDNIYAGTLTDTADGNGDNGSGEWLSLSAAVDDASNYGYISADPFDGASSPSATKAIIYWTSNSNNNDILDQGEHAVMAVVFSDSDEPSALDKLRAEIISPSGSALTIERQVPSITTSVVDLG